jgi:hypothetical protein
VTSVAAVLAGSLAYLAIGMAPSGRPESGSPGVAAVGQRVNLEFAAATKRKPHGPFAGMTAAQIRARPALAMKFGKTVHVQGTVRYLGKNFGIDLQVGKDSNGTLSYDKGGSIAIRRVGNQLFERPDDAYYTAHGHADLIPTRHATWIAFGPEDPDYKDAALLTQIGTWTKLLAGVPATSRKPGAVLDRIPTVALVGGRGPKGTVLYVASTGPSFPLYVLSTDKLDRLAFRHWNTPFTVTAPSSADIRPEPADEILDIPKDPVASAAAFGAIWRP